tara:strand:+ start:607 stop:999 length:393 start_codon:yes stop_codon:yes gene_type:complete
MATVQANISLSSNDIITSSTLAIAVNKALTLDHGGVQRKKITATAVGASATTIYTADDFAAIAYIYIKNLDTTATDYIYIYDDTTSGDPVILKLAGGDWAWLPTNADKTLKAYATTDPTHVEFGVFGADQ